MGKFSKDNKPMDLGFEPEWSGYLGKEITVTLVTDGVVQGIVESVNVEKRNITLRISGATKKVIINLDYVLLIEEIGN